MRGSRRLRDREVVLVREVDYSQRQPAGGGKLFGKSETVRAVFTNAEVQIDAVDRVPKVGEDVPASQAVFATGHGENQAILWSEHPEVVDRPFHLTAHVIDEMSAAEVGVVTPHLDHRLAAANPAFHLILPRSRV